MTPRLFLVAPDLIDDTLLLDCARAATAAADCASIVVSQTISRQSVEALQQLDLAVLLKDAEPRTVHHLRADGLMLSDVATFKEARAALKNESLGLLAGISRHAAMEAAEAGADFIAFTPSLQVAGEPIIGWWQDVTDVPAVALDPVEDASLAPQRPDFIRPSDGMWQNAKAAAQVTSDLMAKWRA